MRIEQLDLKAFGHFTNRRIVFDGAGADFHMAYGPNEAGKTTISRALKAALFGIPERTGDNHLHANPTMRVGVVLKSSGGELLPAMRRKARKNSLVRYDPLTGEELGQSIPDEQLAAWIGGLSEGLYASMFGLDHNELVAGGKALSEGKGEVGQSLFEAGAGLSSIRALRERLVKEADELFRPRASSSAIFREIETYNDARKTARDAQTKPAAWEELKKTAESAKAAYDAARNGQADLQKKARELERLAAVLPDIAARALVLERLTVLGEVTMLPANATAQRIAVEARLSESERVRSDGAEKLARQQAQLKAIALPTTILQEGAAIDAVYYALDTFRTAIATSLSANVQIEQGGARTSTLLGAIGESLRDDLRSLIPSATLRARIQSLVTKGATLQTELDAAIRLAAAANRELNELDAEMAELGEQSVPAALVEAVQGFESEGNPESSATDLTRQVAVLEAALIREAAALAQSGLDTLLAMGTPLPSELQRFRTQRDDIEQRQQSLKAKVEGLEDDIAALSGELEGLVQQGEVPTAEHLYEQREFRESLWQRIRRKAFGQTADKEVAHPEEIPTAAEYEFAVQVADTTADSRFADAARVSQHADLLKRLAQMRNAIDLERGRLTVVDQDAINLNAQWLAFTEKLGLPRLGVAELGDWLNKRDLILQRHHTYADLKRQAAIAVDRGATVRTSLSAALVQAGLPGCADKETLVQAIGRARVLIDQTSKAATSHKILAKKKKNAQDKIEDAAAQIASRKELMGLWRTGWNEAMASIRLAGDAGGEEATARLGQFEDLEEVLDSVDTARAELVAADAVATRMELEVARICEVIGYERATRPTDAVVETMFERLGEARALAQRAKTLEDLIADTREASAQAEQAQLSAQQDLSRLKAAAGCTSLEELIEAENHSTELLRLQAEITAIESRLVVASAMKLPELLALATGQDLVLVKAEQERVSGDLANCTGEVETLHATQIEAQAALGRVDGEASAADAEQKSADAAARLGNLVADFASARLASSILSEAIETYQQRYQGPLLARASELFATITGGRFMKIATDFAEDMTILVGVRPSGKRETVANLSSGTRDQLFLALRLAAIESHVARQEPMPVVVDDIVINFDDASASATFKVLADLSKKTQVLFFTHHEHLLDRAANAIGSGAFVAHKL